MRRFKKLTKFDKLRDRFHDLGSSKDWREYKNTVGLDHFEELLVHQPTEWRVQAREYLYRYKFDIKSRRINKDRPCHELDLLHLMKLGLGSASYETPHVDQDETTDLNVKISMDYPILVAMFHEDIAKTMRYEPIMFLLSYDASDPIPEVASNILSQEIIAKRLLGKKSFSMFGQEDLKTLLQKGLYKYITPLDYFLDVQKHICPYNFDRLQALGRKVSFPRLPLLKELNFCKIIGQRIPKFMITKEVVLLIQNHTNDDMLCPSIQPLSFVFAGPSGMETSVCAIFPKFLYSTLLSFQSKTYSRRKN